MCIVVPYRGSMLRRYQYTHYFFELPDFTSMCIMEAHATIALIHIFSFLSRTAQKFELMKRFSSYKNPEAKCGKLTYNVRLVFV